MVALNPQILGAPPVQLGGVLVQPFSRESLVEHIVEWAGGSCVNVAVGINAHACNIARKDAQFRHLLARSVCYADGQSVVWAARFLGSSLPERLATTDLAEPILRRAAEEHIPVYFLGGAEGVAETAARRLRARIPGLKLKTRHGWFAKEDTAGVLADIASHGTRILFVGMGDPLQQKWVNAYRTSLPPAVLTCGGLFDWLSGAHRRAPMWMIRSGLEWLWRLAIEPRRLARRYLLGNPAFLAAVFREKLRRSTQ